jgi:2-phosphoglycolate phosphatase
MMDAPRGVVFDLDGTLIDSSGDIVAAISHALRVNDKPPVPAATLLRFVGDGARMLSARAVGLPDKHPDVERVLDSYLAYYTAHPVEYTRWMPHARDVLDQIRKYPLAIATNKPRDTTNLVLARLGVRSVFAAVAAAGDFATMKPSPEPIVGIARQLGLEPGQLVVVGDGPQDVEAGRRAGCRTVGVEGGFLPPERLLAARPDVVIASLVELPEVLSRWQDATVRAAK